MKTAVSSVFLTIIALSVCQPLCAADDAAKAQKLIDRAIKAIGGNEALEKSRNTVIEDTGMYYGMGQGLPYKGWMQVMGDVSDMEDRTLDIAQQAYFIGYVETLLPLQKPNKDFRLGLAPAETIEGEECAGITIDYERMPTLTLHFSPKAGLIRKWKYLAKVAELGFQEAVEESVVNEYKEFDGVMCVTKFTSFRDGNKFIEANFHDINFPDTIDDSEFTKPE